MAKSKRKTDSVSCADVKGKTDIKKAKPHSSEMKNKQATETNAKRTKRKPEPNQPESLSSKIKKLKDEFDSLKQTTSEESDFEEQNKVKCLKQKKKSIDISEGIKESKKKGIDKAGSNGTDKTKTKSVRRKITEKDHDSVVSAKRIKLENDVADFGNDDNDVKPVKKETSKSKAKGNKTSESKQRKKRTEETSDKGQENEMEDEEICLDGQSKPKKGRGTKGYKAKEKETEVEEQSLDSQKKPKGGKAKGNRAKRNNIKDENKGSDTLTKAEHGNDVKKEEGIADVVNSLGSSSKTSSKLGNGQKTVILRSMDTTDVTAVLMHMEGGGCMSSQPSTSQAGEDSEDGVMSDEDTDEEEAEEESEGDWEDVEDHHGNSPKKSQIPDKPVEITLEAPSLHKKRKKKGFDLQAYFRRQINKFQREVATDIHKTHLMCLVSRAQYLNSLCNGETVLAQALSITMVTSDLKVTSVTSCSLERLFKILTWIRGSFPVTSQQTDSLTEDTIESRFQSRSVASNLELVMVCVIILRQLGFLTRLLMSLQPLPFKVTANKETKTTKGKAPQERKSKQTKKKKESTKITEEKRKKTAKNDEKKSEKKPNNSKNKSKVEKQRVKGTEQISKRSCTKRLSTDAYKDTDEMEEDLDESGDEFKPEKGVDDESEISEDSSADLDEKTSDAKKGAKRKGAKQKLVKTETSLTDESDSDFEENSIAMRNKSLVRKTPPGRNKKVVSSDSEGCGSASPQGSMDEWIEVYLQSEKKWICFDCTSGQASKPYDIEHKVTQPLSYVIGIDNDGSIKDVTPRYASQWLTSTRKLRADQDWWDETLAPYRCTDRQMDEQEDQDIQGHLLQRPMPTSISAFKNHPLYVLKRHILKYEAIYPDTAVPLGFIRGEPVYARECVHTLHSRENWLKEGRAVRIGEEAYKFVKSRSKWNKPKENPEAKDLELFGPWQTEVYIPPPAVDGKVPRNSHGNVEMFLPSMLPAGTVHLKIPGLNKVAKKLDIDCAPAMVGWDHHCGFSHPLMDGWIVCEEFKDILLAAWDEEQEIIREREAEKREKRVYENWRKLIRGMLIKERLKKRFDLEENSQINEEEKEETEKKEVTKPKSKKAKPGEKATDAQFAWPQNRLTNQTAHTLYVGEEI